MANGAWGPRISRSRKAGNGGNGGERPLSERDNPTRAESANSGSGARLRFKASAIPDGGSISDAFFVSQQRTQELIVDEP